MDIITVKMLESQKGSPDGVFVIEYEEDEIYNLPESLALVFIDELEVAIIHEEEEDEQSSESDLDELD